MVATFNETRTPTSRKYVAEQDIVLPNWSKIIQNFRSHSSVFTIYKKTTKTSNFLYLFLHLIDALVATFNERPAQTSIKYLAEQGVVI